MLQSIENHYVQKREIMTKRKIYKHSSGAVIIYQKDRRLNYSAVEVGFMCGSIRNKENGIAHFVEHMMFKNTKNMSLENINKEMSVLTSFNASTGRNAITVSFHQTNRLLDRALKFASELLFNSEYKEEHMQTEKQVVMEEYTRKMDRLNRDISMQVLYGFTDALKPEETLGNFDDITKISAEALEKYKAENFTINNFVFSYCGNMSFCKVNKMVKKYFLEKFVSESQNKNISVPHLLTSEPKLIVHTNDDKPVKVFCGFRYDFDQLNYYDEDMTGLMHRLFRFGAMGWQNALRDNGLVYGCGSRTTVYGNESKNAFFGFDWATSKEKLFRSFEVLRNSIDYLLAGNISDEDFEDIKNNKIYMYDELHAPPKEVRADSNLRGFIAHGRLREIVKTSKKIKRIKNLKKEDFVGYAKKVFELISEPYVVIVSNNKAEELINYEEIKSIFKLK